MKRNSTIGGVSLTRNHKTLRAVATEQKLEGEGHRAGSAETGRKYKVQVIVTDPEGQEVLNLTNLAFDRDPDNKGFAALDIQEALRTLIEAAGEWSI